MNDKPERNSYCLIRGAFDADTARQLLMTLINDKIRFNQRNHLSHMERFGEDNPAVLHRIEELRQTREDIARLLEEAAADGLALSVHSKIEINLIRE